MSFKLSELLNPPENEPARSQPNPSSHASSSSITRSPESHGVPHSEAHRHGSFSHLPSVKTYETSSALTNAATNASSYQPPPPPPPSFNYARPQSPREQYAPTVGSYSGQGSYMNSSLATGARRPSFTMPPPIPSSPQLGNAPASPTNTSLEQYHHSNSRSPDGMRRQSIPTFEGIGLGHAVANVNGPVPGPQLAPLQLSADRSSPSSLDREDDAPKIVERIKDNVSSPALQHNSQTPIPLSAASAAHFKMEDTAEPTTTIQQVVPQQIREPSAAAPDAKSTPAAPEPATREALAQSPPPANIKSEPIGTPLEGTPVKSEGRRGSSQVEDLDTDTMKAIEAAKNDFGLRAGRQQKTVPSIEEPLPSPPPPTETLAKKRPVPKVKKGQATVKKPPSKKRRVEDITSSTTSRRSLSPSRSIKRTPASAAGKKSKSNTPGLGSSPAPGSVVSAASDEEYGSASDDGNDANDVFCICRKGDNHTWMIACDGGCEDWFHGKCVNIREEDGDLIDKYICPNCDKKFKGSKVTTWLPGCRNPNCRKPARIRKGNMSKYCSDACGREFMEIYIKRSEDARRKAGGDGGSGQAKPKRRGITMAEINGETKPHADEDEDLGPRGGALQPSELKALITSTTDIDSFRALGAGVLSPPATASPTAERFPDSNVKPDVDYALTQIDQDKLEEIAQGKDTLRRRRALLKEREKFGQMIRENVSRYAEREGIKPKDVCGYDGRLAWGEEEFKIWRDSEEGQAALSNGSLELEDAEPATNGTKSPAEEESEMDVDSAASKPKTPPMCTRKRCERHRHWQKQTLADVRFEESELADRMRALDNEEKEIKEAALLRRRMEASGLGGRGEVEVL